MIGMDSDYFKIVKESVEGQREVDEETFASVAVLSDRLSRLKSLGERFSGVSFSCAVEKLQIQDNAALAG